MNMTTDVLEVDVTLVYMHLLPLATTTTAPAWEWALGTLRLKQCSVTFYPTENLSTILTIGFRFRETKCPNCNL